MKCNRCHHNEASVYIEQSINGELTSAHLCSECAFSQNMNVGTGTPPNQAFHAIHSFWFGPEGSSKTYKSQRTGAKICDICGLSFNEFKKTSMLGCASCYKAFEPELLGVFKKVQPGTRHIGKIPKVMGKTFMKDRKIAALELELQGFIASEEYEEAAKTRDQIRLLKSESQKGGAANE
ncbi:MAG: UvrB/UvrC motif-containing protein [Defluviitaleaceae bacterium]|nr:UvrB/UvrC motif-containing protein [Defluviitaleaceae bacterium]